MWYVRSGSKVTGPYGEEQLRALRKRGQFTPVHQISSDRQRWESAASLVKLLDASPGGSVLASQPQTSDISAPDDDQVPQLDSRWYYLDDDQQKTGPLTLSAIKNLIQNGDISSRTLVCARGDSQWIEVAQHPVLKAALPQTWRWFTIIATLVILSVAGVGGSLVVRDMQKRKATGAETAPDAGSGTDPAKPGNQDKTASEKPIGETKPGDTKPGDSKPGSGKGAKDPMLITSLDDEERVKLGIGLVVCGERWKLADGRVVEGVKGYSTGSCFAISSTGHLLTNRHVVSDYATPENRTIKQKTGETLQVISDTPVVVFFNRIRYDAKVLHIDQTFDLAVLKIERVRPQPYFPISKKNSFQRGQKCYALGYPGVANQAFNEEEKALQAAKFKNDRFDNMLLDQNFEYSYQGGEISRVIQDVKKQFRIEHSAKIFHGNSGGPLVDSKCTIIGINTLGLPGGTDTLYVAFATGQFKDIVDEFTDGVADWRE